MDAGLGVGIALHADRLARAFARARIGRGALAAHGQAAQMADATIALDALETLKIHAQFAAKITFNYILALLDRMNDLGQLLLGEVLRADRGINVRALQNFLRVDGTNAVDVAQRDINALVRRDFNSNDACHNYLRLTLTLFVALVRANDTDNAPATHNLAVLAKFFH